jgi:putative Holliday junction resolvase
MKAIGIDYGTKNIGMAVSDDTGIIAGALGNIANYGELPSTKLIIDVIDLYKADTVVIGYPYSYRPGVTKDGMLVQKIKRLKSYLEKKTKVKVEYWDESYSSKIVEKGMRGKARKGSDSLVASFILQGFLDHKAMMKSLKDRGLS